MAKTPTFPTLFDNAYQINITKLKEWGFLTPKQITKSTLTLRRNGRETGSLSIKVCMSNKPYIELNYTSNGKPINYKIELVSNPSNLGKGVLWFFCCPKTNKLCRKLYLIDSYFLHREAFQGCYYEKQTQSKKWRETEQIFNTAFGDEKAYDELYSKHFKKYYNGKPTKRYKRIMQKIKDAENFPLEVLQSLK